MRKIPNVPDRKKATVAGTDKTTASSIQYTNGNGH